MKDVMLENTTTEEKLDYIYKSILKTEKKEKNALIIKWGFRCFMLLYL